MKNKKNLKKNSDRTGDKKLGKGKTRRDEEQGGSRVWRGKGELKWTYCVYIDLTNVKYDVQNSKGKINHQISYLK